MNVQTLPRPVSADASRRYLTVADAIGCRIVRDAIWAGDRCSWMIWTKQPINGTFHSVHKAAPLDLYLGVSGIALFLAQLVRITGDRHQRDTLHAALRQVEHQLQHRSPREFGFYSGAAGAAWALTAIGETMEHEPHCRTGIAALEDIAATADIAGQFDLLGGVAGLILALVQVGERHTRSSLLDHAARLADTLLHTADRSPEGISWHAGAGETRGLLGFSHGTAGVALALLELDRVRPDPRYRDAALGALRYERSLFDASHRNWPDFRSLPGMAPQPPGFPVAWCHGSTGIGFSRLRLHELLPDDAQVLPELDTALVNATAALNAPLSPQATDLTLCHGFTGNNELLLSIGDQLGRPDAIAAALQVADVIVNNCHAARMPWVCGIPECGESPSLMVGSAGIGLHFLRLRDPAVPNILLPSLAALSRRTMRQATNAAA